LPVLLFYKHFTYIERKIKLIINQKLIFIMNRFSEIKDLVLGMESDFEKFYDKKNQAAGTRVRKGMQDLKNLAQDIRKEVQDIKNSEG
jgi:hypothetical protein